MGRKGALSYSVYPACGFAVRVTPKVIKALGINVSEYDGDDIMEKFENAAEDDHSFVLPNGKTISAEHLDDCYTSCCEPNTWYFLFSYKDLFVPSDFLSELNIKSIRPELISWADYD